MVESPVVFPDCRSEDTFFRVDRLYNLRGFLNILEFRVLQVLLLLRNLRDDVKIDEGLQFVTKIFSFADLLKREPTSSYSVGRSCKVRGSSGTRTRDLLV